MRAARDPYVPKNDMEDCDEFEMQTADALLTDLVRLRNDVAPVELLTYL